MKHLKTFENWFTNIFKSGDDGWQDFMDDYIGSQFKSNYNALMGAAYNGNWKRFKNLLPDYKKNINDVNIEHNDDNTTSTENVLIKVVNGTGGNWEKKKMISALIDNGVDPYFTTDTGKSFYDLIIDTKLKKWVEETYPNIVQQIILNKSTNKYNL